MWEIEVSCAVHIDVLHFKADCCFWEALAKEAWKRWIQEEGESSHAFLFFAESDPICVIIPCEQVIAHVIAWENDQSLQFARV